MSSGQAVCFFEFVCSKAWDELDVLGDKSSKRFCPECMKSVYLCKSDDELKMHVKTSHCVAQQKSEGNWMVVRCGASTRRIQHNGRALHVAASPVGW